MDLKVGVSLDHGVSPSVLLHFVSLLALRTFWATFQAKNNVRSAPASSVLTLVSHRSHNMRIENRYLYAEVEKGMELKGEQR